MQRLTGGGGVKAQRRGRYVRYSIDRVTVVVALMIALIQGYLYSKALSPLWVLPLLIVLRWTHLIEHNHAHLTVFAPKRRMLNEVFSWLLTLGTGMPVELYRITHVEVHHRYTNDPAGDWTSPFAYKGAVFPTKPVNLGHYILTFTARGWYRSLKIIRTRVRRPQYRRFRRSMVAVGGVSVLLAWRNPAAFAAFYAIPWVLMGLGSAIANWKHHVDCDYSSPESSANDNLGPFSRALGLNIGYHIRHHMKPGLHWSLLPQEEGKEFGDLDPEELAEEGIPIPMFA